jgi:hypothetical protein
MFLVKEQKEEEKGIDTCMDLVTERFLTCSCGLSAV